MFLAGERKLGVGNELLGTSRKTGVHVSGEKKDHR